MQDLHRVAPWLGQQLGSRIDPGQMQRQLRENTPQRLSDMTCAVEPHWRQWIVHSLHESRALPIEALQARDSSCARCLQKLIALHARAQIAYERALQAIGIDRADQHGGPAACGLNDLTQ